ncbi:MAG TPA: M28 family peptidase [Isosphaeraceae bacterium]
MRTWLIPAVLTLAAPAARAEAPEPDPAALRGHVQTLASPAFAGRGGGMPGGLKAAEYVADALRRSGLEPLFDGRYTQEIVDGATGAVLGRNVGARLPGTDPALRDQWVIVSAHFDHLGVRGGVLYPGADDDASGVAMLLETARCLAEDPHRPRRGVMFVGFDLEENALWGSRYFAAHPPVPLDRVALFVTADMIGRSLGGVCDRHVFVMGTEHAPGLRPWIERAAPDAALTLGLIGTDLVGTRSDYGPFRARRIPYLFFSTGENPCYHTPEDVPETLDYPKLHAISRLILGVVRRAAGADVVPPWAGVPEYPPAEAAVIRDVLRILLDHQGELKIGAYQLALMKNTLRTLDGVIARGPLTPGERTTMVRVAQIVLISVL